jgi:hypothetical protein
MGDIHFFKTKKGEQQMNRKEEGLSMKTVIILLLVIFAIVYSMIYYITSPVWHGKPVTASKTTITRPDDKTIIITSKEPMVVQQYVKETIHSSGWAVGLGSGAGAYGEFIPGYSSSKSRMEPIFIIKIFKLE